MHNQPFAPRVLGFMSLSCRNNDDNTNLIMSSSDPLDVAQQYIEKNKEALSQISFGGVMGYCSGLAFRKASRAVAGVIGMGFICLQGAKSLGYIDVDWNKIRDDAIKPLDVNKDGKVDADDAQIWWQKSQVILKDSVPGAGGFSAGFLLGARRG